MARPVRDGQLENRSQRDRITPSREAIWRTLIPGELALGYRRRRKGAPGYWLKRAYLGLNDSKNGGAYQVTRLGTADDFEDADGELVLSYAQAQTLALERKPSVGPLTVRAALDDYIEHLFTEKKTGRDARLRADALILPELGDERVDELTTEMLTKWRNNLAASPARLRGNKTKEGTTKRARQATANRTWTYLRAALNYAFRLGRCNTDLAWRRVKPFANVNAARKVYLTLEETQRLINAADVELGFRDLLTGALMTGCRYGELAALLVRDFTNNKLHIAQSKIGERRDVALTAEGQRFFASLCVGREPNEYLFLRFGRPWAKSNQARHMIEARKNARIKSEVTFHGLRHAYASLSLTAGMLPQVLAHNLGHTSTRMIERHYGHLLPSFIDQAVAAAAPQFGIKIKPTNVRNIKR